jgi:hypothetical protein
MQMAGAYNQIERSFAEITHVISRDRSGFVGLLETGASGDSRFQVDENALCFPVLTSDWNGGGTQFILL